MFSYTKWLLKYTTYYIHTHTVHTYMSFLILSILFCPFLYPHFEHLWISHSTLTAVLIQNTDGSCMCLSLLFFKGETKFSVVQSVHPVTLPTETATTEQILVSVQDTVGGALASWLVNWLRIEWSGFQPWPGTLCCVFKARYLTLTAPLSTQVYKCWG